MLQNNLSIKSNGILKNVFGYGMSLSWLSVSLRSTWLCELHFIMIIHHEFHVMILSCILNDWSFNGPNTSNGSKIGVLTRYGLWAFIFWSHNDQFEELKRNVIAFTPENYKLINKILQTYQSYFVCRWNYVVSKRSLCFCTLFRKMVHR